jgi:hypothetical protein
VDRTQLKTTISDMQFNWSPGIDVHLTYSATAGVGYDRATNHLTLDVVSQTASTPNAQTQPWLNTLNTVTGVIGVVGGLLAGIGGAVSAFTTPAEAAEAGIQMTQVGSNAAAATATAAQLAGDLNQGTTLAARVTVFLKFAAIAGGIAGVGALPVAVTAILQAIAQGEYDSLPKLTSLTNTAVGKVVTCPAAVGSYTLKTAQLNTALQFGLS